MGSLSEVLLTPSQMVRALHHRAEVAGCDGPAALLGSWGEHGQFEALIAPSVTVEPVDPQRAFSPNKGMRAFGYRSYPDTSIHDGGHRLPEAVCGYTSSVLRRNHEGHWDFEFDEDPQLVSWLLTHQHTFAGPAPVMRLPAWQQPDQAAHRRGVRDCLDAIAAGDVYQACLCTRLSTRTKNISHHTLGLDLACSLFEQHRQPRSVYLNGQWGAVVSCSPEEFVIRHGNRVHSTPIKGTSPITSDPAALKTSEKDVAENIMIVDLVRHDIGQVADIGSVHVTDLLSVRPAAKVWHLYSTVAATTSVSHTELIDACFPPASVTGTPKIKARELLRVWEPHTRGVYCGAVGTSTTDSLELAVAIRTLEITPNAEVSLGVGGGITSDSTSDVEWQECIDKASFSWPSVPRWEDEPQAYRGV